ncbi:Serine/threonine protein kinase [Handroanthus impetiginosus]|uniref:Serine/threonine protein kinase n=1 Tax=Handroanthus impetiginosus TaxID=429701 RepID=A0A2G9GLZ5_9LAMI|nr:Serine/threonine protein kinase [Handroanthus impetiginosus]
MDQTLQAVLAATASFFVVSLILASILIICRGDPKRRRNERSALPARARNFALPEPNSAPDAALSSIAVDESATFDPSLNHVSMQELVDVTGNFSRDLIIGDGSFGLVYKARLNSGPVVAVKKLSPDAFQGLREFRAEMETLGKIRHPNIVKILGYCATGWDRVLIYEFIEKGSLDQWLYDTSSEEDCDDMGLRLPLSWHTRLKIVRGVAKGLAFMHSLETPIIHRDIKASNILLDENFEAHIADFGLARRIEGSHSHVSTQVAGTMGYMPPEYLGGATMATMMGDVYSFGVLMLETITGRRPSFPFHGEDGGEVRLMEWINKMVDQNRYMEMVDSSISKDDLKESIVAEVFKIGIKCADEKCKVRPAMKEVVDNLDKILA